MKRLQFEHVYFCRNCEDEFRGHPFGFRLASHLPLCQRCTEIGEKEGVAGRVAYSEPLSNKIVFFMVAAALFAAVMLLKLTSRGASWS